jgi:hypothetical protein
MRRFNENSERAKHGMKVQQYVLYDLVKYYTVPEDRVMLARFVLEEMGVYDRTSLNLFEKENGDIWFIHKGKLQRIEVASAMPGKNRVSIGQSKIDLYKGEWYCFVLYEDGPDVPSEICFAKREAVLLYLAAIPGYNESKNGGEPYKFFLPKTFRKGIHSTEEFVRALDDQRVRVLPQSQPL